MAAVSVHDIPSLHWPSMFELSGGVGSNNNEYQKGHAQLNE